MGEPNTYAKLEDRYNKDEDIDPRNDPVIVTRDPSYYRKKMIQRMDILIDEQRKTNKGLAALVKVLGGGSSGKK